MLLIVPASSREAYNHLKKTIERPWTVDSLLRLSVKIPANVLEKLRAVSEFHIWGCVPGVRGWDRVWPRLEGFIVAFYREGAIVCWGKVFAKVRDPVLAERLWGRDRGVGLGSTCTSSVISSGLRFLGIGLETSLAIGRALFLKVTR